MITIFNYKNMNTKEYALELYSEFRYDLSLPGAPLGDLKDELAKKFATITVNHIIESNTYIDRFGNKCNISQTFDYNFYNEVIEEIKKL